jgi:AhpD family alkylhydroperoxidase
MCMKARQNPFQHQNKGIQVLFELGRYVYNGSLEPALLELVFARVSQLNGCAYCIDMHTKDLRAHGETEQRIYLLNAWREVALYSEKEKAALGWAEAVTLLENREVPDAVYQSAAAQFSAVQLVDLTLAVTTINTYNRLNIAFSVPAGDYQPGQIGTASEERRA